MGAPALGVVIISKIEVVEILIIQVIQDVKCSQVEGECTGSCVGGC